ncbi:uncharacterized protein LOC128573549 [Nycticebus coucang]|uniref:uncharacterized protein LOC128573549 n=1 Tax=Nycticebus coucang TaxID=9470 RepID=UPI00234D1922|nr:uncharacterized protein LOC128573549 [Nycticebus coucang]
MVGECSRGASARAACLGCLSGYIRAAKVKPLLIRGGPTRLALGSALALPCPARVSRAVYLVLTQRGARELPAEAQAQGVQGPLLNSAPAPPPFLSPLFPLSLKISLLLSLRCCRRPGGRAGVWRGGAWCPSFSPGPPPSADASGAPACPHPCISDWLREEVAAAAAAAAAASPGEPRPCARRHCRRRCHQPGLRDSSARLREQCLKTCAWSPAAGVSLPLQVATSPCSFEMISTGRTPPGALQELVPTLCSLSHADTLQWQWHSP